MTVSDLKAYNQERVERFLQEIVGDEDINYFVASAMQQTPSGLQFKLVVYLSIRTPFLDGSVIPGAVFAEFTDTDESLKAALQGNYHDMWKIRMQMLSAYGGKVNGSPLQLPDLPTGPVEQWRPKQ